jgi:hypothetical protein
MMPQMRQERDKVERDSFWLVTGKGRLQFLDDADVVSIPDENVVNALPAGTICPYAVNQLLSCSREPSADFSTFISEGSVPFPPARVSLLFLYILSGQGQLHAGL